MHQRTIQRIIRDAPDIMYPILRPYISDINCLRKVPRISFQLMCSHKGMGNLSYGLDKIEMMEQKLTVIYCSVQYILPPAPHGE